MPETVTVFANGIRFHALADGEEDGPLVLLLHGFPELSRSWRHQLPALAAAGFRAVAPDLRGYGESARRGPYDARTLVEDVGALVRALGRRRATVVGHDWGGAVAWLAGAARPDAVERLVILNCPHPVAMQRELLVNRRQLARSAYILFFQLPWLPERTLRRDRAAAVGRALRDGAYVSAAWSEDDLRAYREAFAQPGALEGPLGYYRAAFRRPWQWPLLAREPINLPTLVLWGVHDRYLGEELLRPERLLPWFAPGNEPRVVRVDEAGHFLQNEAPARVNRELVDWLRANG